MKFQDLSEQQILELFESAPTQDLNLLYKFYKVYKPIILALVEAYSGYAYQKDLYEVYKAFYAPQKLSYASFSRILSEMQQANLLGATKGNPKTVFMKQKAYELIGKNQTTIHSSRINNRSMRKSQMLTKLHLLLLQKFGANYRPIFLRRDKNNTSIYSVKTPKAEYYFFFCLNERQKSANLADDATVYLNGEVDFTKDNKLHFYFVIDESAKRFDTALAYLKNTASLQYYQMHKLSLNLLLLNQEQKKTN